jgi:signal transduction histidine kinase
MAFLTWSRLERGKLPYAFRALDPRTVVDEAVAALGERARSSGCSIETKVAPDLPAINGDSDALATALLNLLDNACKYSGEEKRIVVCAERCNGAVRFAVSDNGAGLSRRDARRVFGRFYQADRRLNRTAEGCGLGLNIVRTIVEAHGGSVHVASELGRGSTFSIDIPILPQDAK